MKDECVRLIKGFASLLHNAALLYLCYFICRIVFLAANSDMYSGHIFGSDFWDLVYGSIVFDTSIVCYGMLVVAALSLFPLHLKEEKPAYAAVVKWFYLIVNGVFLLSNLPDVIYIRYTGRRTTWSVFHEFANDSNVVGIIFTEALNSWWLIIVAALLLFIIYRFYINPLSFRPKDGKWSFVRYYVAHVCLFPLAITFCVFGMRGGTSADTRPITLSNVNKYVSTPIQAPVVLNTPFCIIRSINHKAFADPHLLDMATAASVYSPVRCAVPDTTRAYFGAGRGMNVVVLIVESLAREYIGGYNKSFIGPDYQGYTPFVDSLLQHSMWCEYSFTNGRKSIDGMPSILSSIPYFVEPFFLTSATLNDLDGLAKELDRDGYETAFFHGAPNGSMGFDSFAKATGFKSYFGMTEYCEDPDFGGKDDFDGHWAIWDEEFLQYFVKQMCSLKEPFLTSVFTASNHHPFRVPKRYAEVFPEEELIINKCTRYTDFALRRFFDSASRCPWYQNTLFVICSDHVNKSRFPQYETDLGVFTGPVMFFSPAETPFRGCRDGVMQQIDVMPTILNYVGHGTPYVAFGNDLLNTPPDSTFAVSYCNGFYQIVKNGYLLQFDGTKSVAFYDLDDKLLEHNLIDTQMERQSAMELQLKAIVQQYLKRMQDNMLVVENDKDYLLIDTTSVLSRMMPLGEEQ